MLFVKYSFDFILNFIKLSIKCVLSFVLKFEISIGIL